MTRFASLAAAAALATYLLIVVGGLVRATDSGLGCPDWPLCFGAWVPPAELHAWIEHSHRLVAAVLVGPLVGATAVVALVTRRHDPALVAAAVIAGVLVVAQSLLGAVVVLEQLRAELVTAHLGMALVVLATTIFIAERASHGPFLAAAPVVGGPQVWVAVAAGATFLQMLLGSWVSGTHAGLAFPDAPLMDGSLWPALSANGQLVQLLHRALALLVAVTVVIAAMQVWRGSAASVPRRLALAAVVLVLVQLLIGAANVWTRLSALTVVPHLAVGAGLWGIEIWLLFALRRATPVAAPAGAPA